MFDHVVELCMLDVQPSKDIQEVCVAFHTKTKPTHDLMVAAPGV